MADYLELPLTADATALSDLGKEYLASEIPGWTARPGNIESVLLEADGQIGAEIVDQVAQVDPIIFAYYGSWLLGINIREGVPATGTVSFTFLPDVLTTIPQGSLLAIPNPDASSYVFQTDAEVRSDATDPTTTVTALEPGADANGSQGLGEMIDAVDGVDTVTMLGAASGGTDEETAEDYLNRLTDALTILAPRPILPQDFATMARQVPGVGRALAIDLYQPSNAEGGYGQPRDSSSHTNVPRCTTVAVTDEDGAMPSNALMQSVYTILDAAREVNFLVYVIPPTYTTIDVTATVVAYPGYILSEVQAAAADMMRQWLDAQNFGSEQIGEEQDWVRQTKVRLYEAIDYLNRAAGVSYVTAVTLGVNGGAQSAADINLTGAAPLPVAGNIVVTVNPPAP